MAREFQRGHKAKISDLTAGTDLYVGVQISGPGLTFDISCFGLDADERLSDDRYFVFFNQPKSPEESIQLLGAQAGDTESFRVTLDKIPPQIQKLSFTATIDGAGQMSQIAPGYIRIVAGGEEVARYSFNGARVLHRTCRDAGRLLPEGRLAVRRRRAGLRRRSRRAAEELRRRGRRGGARRPAAAAARCRTGFRPACAGRRAARVRRPGRLGTGSCPGARAPARAGLRAASGSHSAPGSDSAPGARASGARRAHHRRAHEHPPGGARYRLRPRSRALRRSRGPAAASVRPASRPERTPAARLRPAAGPQAPAPPPGYGQPTPPPGYGQQPPFGQVPGQPGAPGAQHVRTRYRRAPPGRRRCRRRAPAVQGDTHRAALDPAEQEAGPRRPRHGR